MVLFSRLRDFSPQSAFLTPFRIPIHKMSSFHLFGFSPSMEKNLSKVFNSSITESLFLIKKYSVICTYGVKNFQHVQKNV